MSGFSIDDARRLIRAPGPSDHKYSRGVVELATGSDRFPGAAVLGAAGALGVGAGMVRYDGPSIPSRMILEASPEVVLGRGTRTHATVMGSGMAPLEAGPDAGAWRARLASSRPVVVDAGALGLLAGPGSSRSRPGETGLVLTPHAGELANLARALELDDAPAPKLAVEVARRTGAVVLAKGAVTRIAGANGALREVRAPSHWAASAGTGDVLAGALGALLAQSQADAESGGSAVPADRLAELAACAAWLHGWAAWAAARRAAGLTPDARGLATAMGEGAAPDGPTGPIRATELAAALPLAVAAVVSA